MGKSKKREREKDPEERLDKLLKKFKKLNDEVELVRAKVKPVEKPAEEPKESDENLPPNQQGIAFENAADQEGSEGQENDYMGEMLDGMESDGELEWKDIVSIKNRTSFYIVCLYV